MKDRGTLWLVRLYIEYELAVPRCSSMWIKFAIVEWMLLSSNGDEPYCWYWVRNDTSSLSQGFCILWALHRPCLIPKTLNLISTALLFAANIEELRWGFVGTSVCYYELKYSTPSSRCKGPKFAHACLWLSLKGCAATRIKIRCNCLLLCCKIWHDNATAWMQSGNVAIPYLSSRKLCCWSGGLLLKNKMGKSKDKHSF